MIYLFSTNQGCGKGYFYSERTLLITKIGKGGVRNGDALIIILEIYEFMYQKFRTVPNSIVELQIFKENSGF